MPLSNAGGSGSVIGDTTTTMMWIDGVSPLDVLHAYVAAGVALVVCGHARGVPAARATPRSRKARLARVAVDWARVAIVALILTSAVIVNVVSNVRYPEYSSRFPFLGVTVWLVLLATAAWRRPDWSVMPATLRGTVFLLALVLTASMMPVDELPAASWHTALGLGFVSAVFDNIPLTKLALEQGGYDWGVLAYAVGFGGSMIWFGSSAGVAITNLFPEGRSVGRWIQGGWHVILAYVVGFVAVHARHGLAPARSAQGRRARRSPERNGPGTALTRRTQ